MEEIKVGILDEEEWGKGLIEDLMNEIGNEVQKTEFLKSIN